MGRLKALIAYDGTDFFGWQTQKHHPTIQSTIESCLEKISGNPIRIMGAGRTDTGVHASGQVAHFDWNHRLEPKKLLLGLNSMLPKSIRIRELKEVGPEFHARFHARSKTYIYRIDRNRIFNPFLHRYSLHYYSALDLDSMRECARYIEGEHDFQAFQASGTDVVSTVRTVTAVRVHFPVETNIHPGLASLPDSLNHMLIIEICAPGFLRKMVRLLVGTILEICSERRPASHLQEALESGNKECVGVAAPARGLFLEKVIYDDV